MPIYRTYYDSKQKGRITGSYGCDVEATDLDDLAQLIEKRGFGELTEGIQTSHNLRLSALIEAERWPEALHEACFLCYIGLRTGALTPKETLGDNGLVHEIAHVLTIYDKADVYKAAKKRIAKAAAKFEERIPGYPKSHPNFKEMPKWLRETRYEAWKKWLAR